MSRDPVARPQACGISRAAARWAAAARPTPDSKEDVRTTPSCRERAWSKMERATEMPPTLSSLIMRKSTAAESANASAAWGFSTDSSAAMGMGEVLRRRARESGLGEARGSSMYSGEYLARCWRARAAWGSGQAWLASRRSFTDRPTFLRTRDSASSSREEGRPPILSFTVRKPSSAAWTARASESAGVASPMTALTSTGLGEPPRNSVRDFPVDWERQSKAAVSRAKARGGGGTAERGAEASGRLRRAGATVSRAVAMNRREEWPRTRLAGASPTPRRPSLVSIHTMRLWRVSMREEDVRKGCLKGTPTVCHSMARINMTERQGSPRRLGLGASNEGISEGA